MKGHDSRSYSCGHYLRKACIKVSFRSASVPSVVVHEYNDEGPWSYIKIYEGVHCNWPVERVSTVWWSTCHLGEKMTSRSYSCGHYLRKACIKVSFRSASVPSVVVHQQHLAPTLIEKILLCRLFGDSGHMNTNVTSSFEENMSPRWHVLHQTVDTRSTGQLQWTPS
jgi:hypothetical protein